MVPDWPVRWNYRFVGEPERPGFFCVVHRVGPYHEEVCRLENMPPEKMERYAKAIRALPDLLSASRMILAAVDEGEPTESLIASEQRSQRLSILGRLRAALADVDGADLSGD